MMEHQQHSPYNCTSRPTSKLPPSYLPPPSSSASSPLPKYTTIERKHIVRMTSNGPIDESGHEDPFVRNRSSSNARPRIHQAHRDMHILDFGSSSHISQLLDRLDSLSLSNLSQLSPKPHSDRASSRAWPPALSRETSHDTNRHGNNSTSGYDTNSSSSLLSGYFYPVGSSCASLGGSTIRRNPSVPNLRPSSVASSSMASSSGSSCQFNNSTSTNSSVQPATNLANKPKARPNSMHIERPAVTLKDDVIKATDKIEKRVAFLREVAQELLSERNKLENAIRQVRQCCSESHFSDVDLEEISAAVGALERRLETVNIDIRTPRSTEQSEALTRANRYLDELRELVRNQSNINKTVNPVHGNGNGKDVSPHLRFARQRCLSYISSCSSDGVPETPATPIDEKFQRTVIECAAEDQKQIRRTLEAILSQLNQNDKS